MHHPHHLHHPLPQYLVSNCLQLPPMHRQESPHRLVMAAPPQSATLHSQSLTAELLMVELDPLLPAKQHLILTPDLLRPKPPS